MMMSAAADVDIDQSRDIGVVGRVDNHSKAPSTPATMSKQHCRMLQVERFFPKQTEHA